jgi:YfiH family protein
MSVILPDWPAPTSVKAAVSTRRGGLSVAAWRSMNLAYHVGDNALAVEQNWQLLGSVLRLPGEPQLLEQVHGIDVIQAQNDGIIRRADACYSDQRDRVCTVMTADCLPILICNMAGTEVAAVHAGWRGLAQGVVASTARQFKSRPDQLLAWLGPAISQTHFEVGEDVYQAFLVHAPGWG